MEGEGLAGEFGELGKVVVHGLGTSVVVGGLPCEVEVTRGDAG